MMTSSKNVPPVQFSGVLKLEKLTRLNGPAESSSEMDRMDVVNAMSELMQAYDAQSMEETDTFMVFNGDWQDGDIELPDIGKRPLPIDTQDIQKRHAQSWFLKLLRLHEQYEPDELAQMTATEPNPFSEQEKKLNQDYFQWAIPVEVEYTRWEKDGSIHLKAIRRLKKDSDDGQ